MDSVFFFISYSALASAKGPGTCVPSGRICGRAVVRCRPISFVGNIKKPSIILCKKDIVWK